MNDRLSDKKSILIIEDEVIIAEEIKVRLTELGYHVMGPIGKSDQAIDFLSFQNPDLVLCDINIKGDKDGIEVAELIRKKKNIPFVFLTSLADRSTIERAKAALPYGYIVKPFDERDLLSGIEIGLHKFQQELNGLTINRKRLNEISTQPLTSQEFKVLFSMIRGQSFEEVSEALFISKNTVKFHAKNIYQKFESSGRTEVMQKLLMIFARM